MFLALVFCLAAMFVIAFQLDKRDTKVMVPYRIAGETHLVRMISYSALILNVFGLTSCANWSRHDPPDPPLANKGAPMSGDCCLSFRDLFLLAKKRPWTADEERYFQTIDQPTRNKLVKELALEARCIKTEDRRGTDGQIYTAFWMDKAQCGRTTD